MLDVNIQNYCNTYLYLIKDTDVQPISKMSTVETILEL